MADIKCSIDDFASVLAYELSIYTEDVGNEVKQAIDDVSQELVENIKRDSPRRVKGKRAGRYAKGWTLKTEYESKTNKRNRVYNKTDYRLTHLLEYGHAKVGGGRVEGKAHIRPNEEKAIEKLQKRIEEAVKG